MIKALTLFSSCVAVGLTACSPRVTYLPVPASNAEPDPPNALRFTLQDAALILAKPVAPSPNGAAAKTLSTDSCAATHATGDTFNLCWTGVSSPSVVAVAKDDGGTYIAEPNDFLPSLLYRTVLSGTPVTNTSYLYQKVQVNYTDNLSNTISTAGAGAATGFSLGGLPGAAVGGLLGAVVAGEAQTTGLTAEFEQKLTVTSLSVSDFVCPSVRQKLDLSKLPGLKTPALGLPITISVSGSEPFVPMSKDVFTAAPNATNDGAAVGCWRPLPNTLSLNRPPPVTFVSARATPAPVNTALVQAGKGDGWFYRIMISDDKPEANGGHLTSDYMPSAGKSGMIPSGQFPYSYCQDKAFIEITWWSQIANAAALAENHAGKATPGVLRFPIPKFPDPAYVSVVNLPRGGTITFNGNCGAVAQSGYGPNISADWNMLNTQAAAYMKAESTYDQAKAAAAKKGSGG